MRILPRVGLGALLLFGAIAPGWAEDAAALASEDRAAIEGVVVAQIDAFRHDDGERAFGFAAPSIQEMFGDASHFMAMVRQGYAPVYRPRSVRLGEIVTVEGRIVQRVALVGPDGLAALALYTMEREPDGTWRIGGCALTKPDSAET